MNTADQPNFVTYALAGLKFRVAFGDPMVGLVCQAFLHLCQTEGAADYEIVFRKTASAQPARPSPAPAGTNGPPARTIDCARFTTKEGFALAFHFEDKLLVCSYSEQAFGAENRGGEHYTSFYHNDFNEEVLPQGSSGVLAAFFWLLEELGVFRLHAAHVRFDGQDVLLIGRGKVGKTTLALNIAMNGGAIYCDDVVFFRESRRGDVEVHPFPKALSVAERTRELLPGLNIPAGLRDAISQKHHLPVGAIFPGARMESGVPRLALFPSILAEGTTEPDAEERSAYEGFVACLDGGILLPPISPAHRRPQIELLERLCNQVRPFAFRHGPDMGRNFQLFRSVLAK